MHQATIAKISSRLPLFSRITLVSHRKKHIIIEFTVFLRYREHYLSALFYTQLIGFIKIKEQPPINAATQQTDIRLNSHLYADCCYYTLTM